MPYGQTAPTINPNTFPYRRKWTREETDELTERIEKLREAMVDMVGPSGAVMYIDAGTIAHIACHLALAGADLYPVDDPRTYIWPDRKEDASGIFDSMIEWRVKKDHTPPKDIARPKPELDPDKVAAAAAKARQQIDAQLHPEVKAALIKQMAKEFEHDTTDPDGDEE